MPKFELQPIIDEVEYYKKGGKIKRKKKKSNAKQIASKHGVNIYIDNSKKSSRRPKTESYNRQTRQTPNIISISNPGQQSSNNGLGPMLFEKLLEKLGEKTNIDKTEKLVESDKKFDDYVDEVYNQPGEVASGAINSDDKSEKSSSSSSAGFIPSKDDNYDEHITLDGASGKLRQYFANYPEFFNKNKGFKKGVVETLAKQYGVNPEDYSYKELTREIYKKIHGI